MGTITIQPEQLRGNISVPPSKSIAHRAVICSFLGGNPSLDNLRNLDYSDDIIATSTGMKALLEKGEGGDMIEVDCNESGSTLRFLVPISLVKSGGGRFLGKGNLGKRPLTPYFTIFESCGISWENRGSELLDLTVKGCLIPGDYHMPGDVSSQFITGLLFSLPLLAGDSTLKITTPLESKGYLDLTMATMKAFGVTVHHEDYRIFRIKGNQSYHAVPYEVEGDYSQAAFFLCAKSLGNDVTVDNLNPDSLQGDKEIHEILLKLDQAKPGETVVIDGSQCPDVIPVAAATAALKEGVETRFVNAQRLRIKECDRIAAVTSEMNKLGADIAEQPDGFLIRGKSRLKGGTVWSHKDHRIAMMLAIAATCSERPVELLDWECVSKSYPAFFRDYEKLGGIIHG